jgi:Ca-activated chloride channel family protein
VSTLALSFLSPARLWLLIVVVVAAAAVIWSERRRRSDLRDFAAPDMFGWLAPRRQGWRYGGALVGLLLALTMVVVASARPARSVDVPVKVATVIVAVDKSTSMGAEDVSPDRITAAKDSAVRFVQDLPRYFRVGVVLFAGTVDVDVAPSTDRALALDAIRRAKLDDGTAIGEAIFTSLDALTQDAGLTTRGSARQPKYPRLRYSAVVLLSDGSTNSGRPDSAAAAAARTAGVPVSTIAFGTDHGVIDAQQAVPVDNATLGAIARRTDGEFFRAENRPELTSVFDSLGFRLAYRTEARPVTEWFVGAALVLALLTAVLSLTWFARLP